MGYINPLFNEQRIIKEHKKTKVITEINQEQKVQLRKPRADKTHKLKFPVSNIERMKLQSLCKQVQRTLKSKGLDTIQQTKFNTLLLHYGLNNLDIVTWDWSYQDSKHYMHTNLLETVFESEIGGPFGLAIRKGLSERKTAYMVIMSVLKWLEGGGSIEEII
ncbi:hypothetical protein NDK25_23990 [Niallia taxi]|nr:hypothetical protein [Niallia taxi]MDE5055281.1 hypothetical protein [Niallia taxi]